MVLLSDSSFSYRAKPLKDSSTNSTNHGATDGNPSPSPSALILWQDGYIDFLKRVWQGVVIPYVPPASCEALQP